MARVEGKHVGNILYLGSEEENEEAFPLIGEEGNRIINGIKRTGEDLFRVYQAPIGDVSPAHQIYCWVCLL